MRLGIDLGGTKIEGIVLGDDRSIVARRRRPTPASKTPDDIVDAIAELVSELEGDRRLPVGVGAPGTISRASGRIKNSNTVSLNGQPLRERLSERLSRDVRMANDANCFAVSEAMDGAAAGHDVVFGVILGTGVGGGIVVDGRPLDGPNGLAGEWGHTRLEPTSGPSCYCGERGCVETLLSGPGLAGDFARAGGDPSLDAEAVARRAMTDPIASATLDRYIDRFGRALATVVDVLDPDCIVLGGGLSAIDRLYADGPAAVRRAVFGREFDTPIVRNRHGDASGVRGAAMLWPAPS